MFKMVIKAIIFDMDGVLIDSTKYIFESLNILLDKFGVHIPDEDIKKYLGRSLRDLIKEWKENYGLKQDIECNEFSKEAFEVEINLLRKKIKKNHNLINLMKVLKENNFKLAVATSSHKLRADKILELIGVRNRLDIIITVEDVENHKPHPDIFLKAAEELNVNPKDCVVVEDAVNGIKAAKNAGMKVIALLTKFQEKQNLKEADLIIESLGEVNEDLINKL